VDYREEIEDLTADIRWTFAEIRARMNKGEYTFTQDLRNALFAIDAALGAVLGYDSAGDKVHGAFFNGVLIKNEKGEITMRHKSCGRVFRAQK
jgi:hypothetical protein